MAGLDDLLKGAQQGGGGGIGDILGSVLGKSAGSGGSGGGLGDIFGQVLKGGGGDGAGASSGGPLGGVLKMLLPMVVGMLASGGLGKILGGMRASGLSAQADSWVGTGQNEPVSAEDVKSAVGPEQIAEIADRLGVSHEQAAEVLAEVLPTAVDHVTPSGRVPPDAELESELARLLEGQ